MSAEASENEKQKRQRNISENISKIISKNKSENISGGDTIKNSKKWRKECLVIDIFLISCSDLLKQQAWF